MSKYGQLIERLRTAEGYDFDLFHEVVTDLHNDYLISDAGMFRIRSAISRVDCQPVADALDKLDKFMIEFAEKALHLPPESGISTSGISTRYVGRSTLPVRTGRKHVIVSIGRENEGLQAVAATITAAVFILMLNTLSKVEVEVTPYR